MAKLSLIVEVLDTEEVSDVGTLVIEELTVEMELVDAKLVKVDVATLEWLAEFVTEQL